MLTQSPRHSKFCSNQLLKHNFVNLKRFYNIWPIGCFFWNNNTNIHNKEKPSFLKDYIISNYTVKLYWNICIYMESKVKNNIIGSGIFFTWNNINFFFLILNSNIGRPKYYPCKHANWQINYTQRPHPTHTPHPECSSNNHPLIFIPARSLKLWQQRNMTLPHLNCSRLTSNAIDKLEQRLKSERHKHLWQSNRLQACRESNPDGSIVALIDQFRGATVDLGR
jgi:hypothetical protein